MNIFSRFFTWLSNVYLKLYSKIEFVFHSAWVDSNELHFDLILLYFPISEQILHFINIVFVI
jgi:hypothetical protein